MDKPKAYIWNGELFWAFEYEVIKEKGDDAEPLYTAPLKREWVGLDPETMRNTTLEFNRGALWAERYLKEKNA
jgi:hypothetical protein